MGSDSRRECAGQVILRIGGRTAGTGQVVARVASEGKSEERVVLDEATKADQSQWMRGQSGNAEGGGAGVVVRKTEPPPTGVVGVLGAVPKRAARGGGGGSASIRLGSCYYGRRGRQEREE